MMSAIWLGEMECPSQTGIEVACNILRLDTLDSYLSAASLKIQCFLD